MSLQSAPAHILLAVDLIELLENNGLPADTVLKALTLVQQDYQHKLSREQMSGSGNHDERLPISR
jgi:hypothetical protein